MSEDGKKGGKKAKELGLGICGFTTEQRTENGKKYNKKSGKKSYELGVGVHGRTKEKMSEDGKIGGKIGSKITNSQKWMCLETGYVSTSGPLTRYQNKRGIDTSKRIRMS